RRAGQQGKLRVNRRDLKRRGRIIAATSRAGVSPRHARRAPLRVGNTRHYRLIWQANDRVSPPRERVGEMATITVSRSPLRLQLAVIKRQGLFILSARPPS
ncbi:hypothetical protein EDWATA_01010, partial [Edwardsiella tarda ATCC 23685]